MADLERMSILARRVGNIQHKIEIIKEGFKNTAININIEIKSQSNIEYLVKEVEKNLNQIRLNSKKYNEVLEFAQKEYRKSDEKITRLYEQLDIFERENNNIEYRLKKKQRQEIVSIIEIREKIKPCSLPKKEKITNSIIIKGVIDEGQNILIRTWRKHY